MELLKPQWQKFISHTDVKSIDTFFLEIVYGAPSRWSLIRDSFFMQKRNTYILSSSHYIYDRSTELSERSPRTCIIFPLPPCVTITVKRVPPEVSCSISTAISSWLATEVLEVRIQGWAFQSLLDCKEQRPKAKFLSNKLQVYLGKWRCHESPPPPCLIGNQLGFMVTEIYVWE